MNTAAKVDEIIKELKSQLIPKHEFVVIVANACIGWTYIFGSRGSYCTPSYRKSVYKDHPTYTNLIDKCQVLKSGKANCVGCQWYPGGKTRSFDCRGFTAWLFSLVGITISGHGATTQYENDSNWEEKGLIKNMPADKVCCTFRYDSNTKKYEHTLLYDGKGNYIHDSGCVKKTPIKNYKATHYAIPKGLYSKKDEVTIVVEYATVINGSLNMRIDKNANSTRITSIPNNSKVAVLVRDTEWCKVTYKNDTGYVMTKYLNFESGSEDTKVTITLSRDDATALYEALKLSLNK